MTDAKMEIQIGNISVKYAGSQAYIENDMLTMIRELVDLGGAMPLNDSEVSHNSQLGEKIELQHMTTNTIAGEIGVKTGPDLILAAAAHIQLVMKRDKATRSEISDQMKGATTYFKNTYVSNLSAYLDNLVRQRKLNLIGKDVYALTASEVSNFSAILSQN